MNGKGSLSNARSAGRPLDFDRTEAIDSALEVFWRDGFAGATTRSLESALGVGQSSIYNTFGSKRELLDQVVDRYEERLRADVLAALEVPNPGKSEIVDFVEAMTAWVGSGETPGCLVLNLAAERSDQGYRVAAYLTTLRRLLGVALASFTDESSVVAARTELLVAAVLGLNILARSGASGDELTAISAAVEAQIYAW